MSISSDFLYLFLWTWQWFAVKIHFSDGSVFWACSIDT